MQARREVEWGRSFATVTRGRRVGQRAALFAGAWAWTAGLAAAPTDAEQPLVFRFERVAMTGEQASAELGPFTSFSGLSLDQGRVAFLANAGTDANLTRGAFLRDAQGIRFVFQNLALGSAGSLIIDSPKRVSMKGDVLTIQAILFQPSLIGGRLSIGFVGVRANLSDGSFVAPVPPFGVQPLEGWDFDVGTLGTATYNSTNRGVVFAARIDNRQNQLRSSGVFRLGRDGGIETLVGPSDTPPAPGALHDFNNIQNASGNGDDTVFTSRGPNLPIPQTNGALALGLFTIINGQIRLVADWTTDLPGGDPSDLNAIPVAADIDDGAVVFAAIAGGAIGGVFTNLGGPLRAVALEGQRTPDGDGVFARLASPVAQLGDFQTPRISKGRIVFVGDDDSNRRGLYLEDADALTRVVRTGDALDGRRVAAVFRDLDIDGETIGFIATFEDGAEAIYTATIDRCPGDFDADGSVGAADLMALLGAYGAPDPPSGGFGARDLDLDGSIGPSELLTVLSAWGDCAGR